MTEKLLTLQNYNLKTTIFIIWEKQQYLLHILTKLTAD